MTSTATQMQMLKLRPTFLFSIRSSLNASPSLPCSSSAIRKHGLFRQNETESDYSPSWLPIFVLTQHPADSTAESPAFVLLSGPPCNCSSFPHVIIIRDYHHSSPTLTPSHPLGPPPSVVVDCPKHDPFVCRCRRRWLSVDGARKIQSLATFATPRCRGSSMVQSVPPETRLRRKPSQKQNHRA